MLFSNRGRVTGFFSAAHTQLCCRRLAMSGRATDALMFRGLAILDPSRRRNAEALQYWPVWQTNRVIRALQYCPGVAHTGAKRP